MEYLTGTEHTFQYGWLETCLHDIEFQTLHLSFNWSYDKDISAYEQKYINCALQGIKNFYRICSYDPLRRKLSLNYRPCCHR
jgi:hypothetical protein